MSRIKPIGSEKLQGDEKLKRILEIVWTTVYNYLTVTRMKLLRKN